VGLDGAAQERDELRGVPRTSVGHLASRVLLDRYTPPSVAIDRQMRIVYYHGQTQQYLRQPTGEPTHDVLTLAKDFIRVAGERCKTLGIRGSSIPPD
jgi:hypothetical protein